MSWEQYSNIVRRDAEERELEESLPPVDCPNDGTVLEVGPNGVLHCPFDGWTYDGC